MEGSKGWNVFQCTFVHTPTLQRKFHLCIPFLGIARPQPFSSFMCLWAFYLFPVQYKFTCFLQQNKQIEYLGIFVSNCIGSLQCIQLHRVAAIFPERFQSFTDALKIVFYINYFAQICPTCLPKCTQRKTYTFMQKWINWKLQQPWSSLSFAPDVPLIKLSALNSSKKHWLQCKNGSFFLKCIAAEWSADIFMTTTKIHKRHSNCKGTVLAADLEELIARGLRRSMRPLAWEMSIFRTTVRTIVSEDFRYKVYAMSRVGKQVNWCRRQVRDAELDQGESLWHVGEGDLASQLVWLWTFELFYVWCLWVWGQCKASPQNCILDPKDHGGDGVPRQGHRGEDLPEIQV